VARVPRARAALWPNSRSARTGQVVVPS